MSRLRHPGIIGLEDNTMQQVLRSEVDTSYILLEVCSKGSLSEFVEHHFLEKSMNTHAGIKAVLKAVGNHWQKRQPGV